jgi:hypothetical protein
MATKPKKRMPNKMVPTAMPMKGMAPKSGKNPPEFTFKKKKAK